MYLGNRIKELREEKKLLQRQLAAHLEIDTPLYSKIERGKRKAKRTHVNKLARIFQVKEEELLILWIAGQIYDLVKDEEVAQKAISLISKDL